MLVYGVKYGIIKKNTNLVFAISTGIEAVVVTKPEIIDAQK